MLQQPLMWLSRILALLTVLGFFALTALGCWLFVHQKYRLLAVQTGSMAPALRVGDGIVVQPIRFEQARIGEVITYKRGTNTISHRVKSIDEHTRTLITQGDANSLADSPVSSSILQGKAVAVVPYVGKAKSLFAQPLIVLVAFYIPSTGLIVYEALRLERSLRRPYRAVGYGTG